MKRIVLNGIESRYSIDSEGNVYGSRGLLKPIKWCQGRYLMYSFNLRGKKVRRLAHRIVAEYCLPDVPECIGDMVVNHINCDKMDNSIGNLEWVTEEENIRHQFDTVSAGTPYQTIEAHLGDKYVGSYRSLRNCAKSLGLNPGNVHQSLQNGWKCKGYSFNKI